MVQNKEKYETRSSDWIPFTGMIDYISRTSANPLSRESMQRLQGNYLARGVTTITLMAYNIGVVVGLEMILNR